MRRLIITIDHLLSSKLNPNARVHWGSKASASKKAREEAAYIAKGYWVDRPPMERAKISYEFHFKSRRLRDEDNLIAMCKPYQDGLKDAGVLTADDSKHVRLGAAKVVYGDRDYIIITVDELE